MRRFHVLDISAPVVQVSGAEADHALRVLRLGVGEAVAVFDGSGHEAIGRIAETGKGYFKVQVHEHRGQEHGAANQIVIATALPKGERADWLVEKCAELGVSAVIPINCERATVRPGDAKLERLRRKVVAAAKQAERATIMPIAPLTDLSVLLTNPNGPLAFGDTSKKGTSMTRWLSSLAGAATVTVLIGPEGGFSDAERQTIQNFGGCGVNLAQNTLRIETACLSAAAIWSEWAMCQREI